MYIILVKEERIYRKRDTNKSNWKYIYIYIRTILKHNMAALTNHENIQNNINQKHHTTTQRYSGYHCIIKAKKVGKSTTEYEVSFDDDNARKTTGGSKKMTLQERFAAMRRRKLAQQQHTHYVAKKGSRSVERKQKLRNKFIEQVKKYKGIPYARKYRLVHLNTKALYF